MLGKIYLTSSNVAVRNPYILQLDNMLFKLKNVANSTGNHMVSGILALFFIYIGYLILNIKLNPELELNNNNINN